MVKDSPSTQYSFRMTAEEFKKLEAELLPSMRISKEDTSEVVAQRLGIALALKTFRDKFVLI